MNSMQKTVALIALLLSVFLPPAAQAGPDGYRLYASSSGRSLSVEGAGRLIADCDVILFGEYHGQPVLHRLEGQLLAQAYAHHPNLAVSLEMLERDVQPVLNAYLAGKLEEELFLDQSRPWKNYRNDYRPLVEFARERGLRVLAANIPRPVAAQYARQGKLDGLSDSDARYLPQVHSAPAGEYRRRFVEQLSRQSGQDPMKLTQDRIASYYLAQCLKDDTMAETILEHHRRYPGRKIIHFQGDFHSRCRLGVAEKLLSLAPALRVVVFTPVYVEDFKRLSREARQHRQDGDIIVFLPKPAAE